MRHLLVLLVLIARECASRELCAEFAVGRGSPPPGRFERLGHSGVGGNGELLRQMVAHKLSTPGRQPRHNGCTQIRATCWVSIFEVIAVGDAAEESRVAAGTTRFDGGEVSEQGNAGIRRAAAFLPFDFKRRASKSVQLPLACY